MFMQEVTVVPELLTVELNAELQMHDGSFLLSRNDIWVSYLVVDTLPCRERGAHR